MNFDLFHFANPNCLFLLVLIPVISSLYLIFFKRNKKQTIENFADPHLIPHLLLKGNDGNISIYKSILLGSIIWLFMVLALSGPRWGYKEVKAFKLEQNLVVVMDLSDSMRSNDIKPTRFDRMRQEVEDLLNLTKNIKIGVVGFAADAHIITPITDDKKTLERFLPLIGTDLIYIQGTRIDPALRLASTMLNSEGASSKHVLLITDGGFEDDYSSAIKKLKDNKITLSCIGIGTQKGINFVGPNNQPIKRNGKRVISRLEKNTLIDMTNRTGGKYITSHFTDKTSKKIIKFINSTNNEAVMQKQTSKQWDEKFYIFLLPLMIMFFPWFKRGYVIPILIFVIITSTTSVSIAAKLNNTQQATEQPGSIKINDNNSLINKDLTNNQDKAGSKSLSAIMANQLLDNLFLNDQQRAKKYIEEGLTPHKGDKAFDDPYQKGVVFYKQKKFSEAEKLFKKVTSKKDKVNSLYNLGNSQAFQYKIKEAIKTYEELLELDPEHVRAEHNLRILKKINEEQQPDIDQSEDESGGGGDKGDDNPSSGKDKSGDDEDSNSDKDQGDNDSDHNEDADKDGNKDDQGEPRNSYKKPEDKGEEQGDPEGKNDDSKEDEKGKDNKGEDEKNNNNGEGSEQQGEETGGANDSRSETDKEAARWLARLSSDPKEFLKSQFRVESLRNKTKPSNDPW
jgi:Ca-activated chloride channel family protein